MKTLHGQVLWPLVWNFIKRWKHSNMYCNKMNYWYGVLLKGGNIILKLPYKSLIYFKLNSHKVSAYSLRSSIAPVLSIPRELGTFRHSAATIFNKLPVAIRNTTEYNSFCRSVKRHFFPFI